MVAPAVEGIDLFKIAGRSISGWIPSLKTGAAFHVRQPFCSQLEEQLLLRLEYNLQVVSYARGDSGTPFATTYRLPTLKHAPFTIGYAFENKPHDYLPDVVGTLMNGKLFISQTPSEPVPAAEEPAVSLESGTPVPDSTFDASTLPEKQREQFHRNLRAVEQVLAEAAQTRIAGG